MNRAKHKRKPEKRVIIPGFTKYQTAVILIIAAVVFALFLWRYYG